MQYAKLSLGVAWSAYCQDRPTNNPIGDPDMAHLPLDSQKCPRWQTSVRGVVISIEETIVQMFEVDLVFAVGVLYKPDCKGSLFCLFCSHHSELVIYFMQPHAPTCSH